jgi:hypothetical protein
VTVEFPANVPDDLNARGREVYRNNRERVTKELQPGTWMRYDKNITQGAHWFRLRKWPDYTMPDIEIANRLHGGVGMSSNEVLLAHETPIFIIATNFDGFGNAWCYVMTGGRLGYLPGGHLVTNEKRALQGIPGW